MCGTRSACASIGLLNPQWKVLDLFAQPNLGKGRNNGNHQ